MANHQSKLRLTFSLNSLLDEINFYLVKFDFLTVILIGKNDLRLDGVNAI